MLERLMLALALLAAGYLAYRWWTARQLGRIAEAAPRDPLLADAPQGIPVIVYFTTPGCVPCRTQQAPTLDRLKRELGDGLHLVKVDATQDPDAADRWGVFSAPTTFVLSADGQARAVNHGVADAHTLKQQLQVA